jgi:ketosteroid isomerase-like protein
MYYRAIVFAVFFLSCSTNEQSVTKDELQLQLEKAEKQRLQAERNADLETFIGFYDPHAIVMPEYQPPISGMKGVRGYFSEVFKRIVVRDSELTISEVLDFDSTLVEFGTFVKHCSIADSGFTLQGKYCNVWSRQSNGNLKIKGECFGYFHPVDNPLPFVVNVQGDLTARAGHSFELKAYNALMEKGVKTRDGSVRADFFTDDGVFYPFADSAVVGMKSLRPYLIEYSGGNVTIDSISCYTLHHEQLKDAVLEYDAFHVVWEVPGVKGKTEGKGIRIWKRMPDLSLRLYREIGTHNYHP